MLCFILPTNVSRGPNLTALTVCRAARRHPSAVSISHHDERGAGFYAVGFARAGRGRGGTGAYSSPTTSGGSGGGGGSGVLGMCALVTSSGTAVANLLPAAAEADAAGLAMVLLTADRPPELRGCGANQTIDQVPYRILLCCVERCTERVGGDFAAIVENVVWLRA